MKVQKNTQGNILIKNEDDTIEHIIATDAFVLKHPRDENAVLVSKTASNQQE